MTANALLAPVAGPGLLDAALCPEGKVKNAPHRAIQRGTLRRQPTRWNEPGTGPSARQPSVLEAQAQTGKLGQNPAAGWRCGGRFAGSGDGRGQYSYVTDGLTHYSVP